MKIDRAYLGMLVAYEGEQASGIVKVVSLTAPGLKLAGEMMVTDSHAAIRAGFMVPDDRAHARAGGLRANQCESEARDEHQRGERAD